MSELSQFCVPAEYQGGRNDKKKYSLYLTKSKTKGAAEAGNLSISMNIRI